MSGEVVDWNVDRVAGAQRVQVLGQKRVVQRIRVIEIQLLAFDERELRTRTVVIVVGNQRDRPWRHRGHDAIGYRGLARPSTPNDANEERSWLGACDHRR